MEFAVFVGFDPGYIVADSRDLPTFVLKRLGRDEHREIRLAAGRREGGTDVIFLPIRRFNADDEHVFGEPALSTPQGRSDTQRKTFLTQKSVAAVS